MGRFKEFSTEIRRAFKDAFASPSGVGVQSAHHQGMGIWDSGAISGQSIYAGGAGGAVEDPMFSAGSSSATGAGIRADSPWDVLTGDSPEAARYSSAINRIARYAEYDFLDSIPEVWSGLNTYADEASPIDDKGHVCSIQVENATVKEELEWLFFTKLSVDDEMTTTARGLCKYGDVFSEIIIDPDDSSEGVQAVRVLPSRSMWRVETVNGNLVEFQQSWAGPDYSAVVDKPLTDVDQKEDQRSMRGHVTRFFPSQIVHARINVAGSTFYPYGTSVLAVARRPAHMLRLMEDAMIVYRITRAPEKRVFYVDIGNLHPSKTEEYLARIRDKLKKKSIYNQKTGSVDERYSPYAADEDFFLPTRNGVGTKVETLPGGQNLGEVDDVMYFRNKLALALRVPKGYFERDINADSSKFSLSSRDIEFAKTIHRIQKSLARALKEIAVRHLRLLGIPEEKFEDLSIVMTPPSPWLEIMHAEVLDARLNRATSALQAGLMAHYDIFVQLLNYSHEEALEMIRRLHEQQIQESRLEAFKTALQARAAVAAETAPEGLTVPSISGEGEVSGGVEAAPENSEETQIGDSSEEESIEPEKESDDFGSETRDSVDLAADEEDSGGALYGSSPEEVASVLGLADRLA